jgi:hypothetical protein
MDLRTRIPAPSLLLAGAVALFALLPGRAEAATALKVGSQLRVVTQSGEANDISIAAGKTAVVKVKLNRRGRRGMRGRKHRRARMMLAVRGADGKLTTKTATITLKSERRRPVRQKTKRKPRRKKGGRKR